MDNQHDETRLRLSTNASLNSNDIIDVLHPKNSNAGMLFFNCFRNDLLTEGGKRTQMIKILTLILLPIFGLWTFTVYGLFDSLEVKATMEQTQTAVKISVEIGRFLDRIQRERDMSVLYLSILGPQTKTFLRNEYLLTDQALDQLTSWPLGTAVTSVFHSKVKFHSFLNKHRQLLNPKNFDIYVEIDFYNSLIEPFVEWLYDAISESSKASMWKILVSYQKIVTGMEQIGIERALGVVFFVNGGFPNKSIYENYNRNVNIFKSNYRSAVLYSKQINDIFQKGMLMSGTNLTAVIETFRYEIQHSVGMKPSVIKGQWWFDNMTLYLDTLLVIQQDLANLINDEVEIVIKKENMNLTITGIFLFVVFLMCPLVIYFVQTLTTEIQTYALILVNKTKELHREMRKTDTLLNQVVPSVIAVKLKKNESIDAEYFKSTTIMFSEIVGFTQVTVLYSPLEIVEMLNILYKAFDEQVTKYNVYTVETINDAYMIASGLPVRIDNKHSAEIAHLALDFIEVSKNQALFTINEQHARVKIGINTGSCMAGVVGNKMPRYCIFGDSVSIASRMKATGEGGKIQISAKAYSAMKSHGVFIMSERGQVLVKRKGSMKTYWLDGRVTRSEGQNEETVNNDSPAFNRTEDGIQKCNEPRDHAVPSTSSQPNAQAATAVAHTLSLGNIQQVTSADNVDACLVKGIPSSRELPVSKTIEFIPMSTPCSPAADKLSNFGVHIEREDSSQTGESHELPGEILERYATDPHGTVSVYNEDMLCSQDEKNCPKT